MEVRMLFAGIDIGSVSTEMVILEDSAPARSIIMPTGSNSRKAAEKVLYRACEETGYSLGDFQFIVATGYGRKTADFSHRDVTELSCHARGAWHLNNDVRTVIDIGGQDSKVIRVGQSGKSLDFIMNDKCAAGTGRFLEVMSRALEVEIGEMGEIAVAAKESVQISSMCTVFAESEVVSLIAEGKPRDCIIRGLMDSIASRVVGMVHRVGPRPPFMLTGGVAKNRGVVRALERKLSASIQVPDEPQIVGALGAALIATDAKAGL